MYKVEAGVVFISKIDLVTLENLLLEIDNEFIPALSQRVNIIEYARKHNLTKEYIYLISLDFDE